MPFYDTIIKNVNFNHNGLIWFAYCQVQRQVEDETGEIHSTFIATHFLKRDIHYVIKVL